MYENRLSTAKQLNVSQKSWFKLAKEFSLHLGDRDTKDLNEVQRYVENWKLTMAEVREEIHLKEVQTKKSTDELAQLLKNLRANLATDTL